MVVQLYNLELLSTYLCLLLIETQFLSPTDVYTIVSAQHDMFYGNYRKLIRNLHNTNRQRTIHNKKCKQIGLENEQFNLKDYLNLLIEIKPKAVAPKIKCEYCGYLVYKSQKHQSGTKCKNLKEENKKEVYEEKSEDDEENLDNDLTKIQNEYKTKKRKHLQRSVLSKKQKKEK